MTITTIVLSALFAYLLGSISFSYLFGKLLRKVDIREHGSGNAGATNTLRVLGKGPAIFVLLLDIFKGVAAVLISYALGGEQWVPLLAGIFAIIGHNWPLYFKFRGGKGIATTIGVLVTVIFLPALCAGIVAIGFIVVTRYVSLGSLVFTSLTPLFAIFIGDFPLSYVLLTLMIALLSLWRHRSNLSKLFQGTESKLGEKVNLKDVNHS